MGIIDAMGSRLWTAFPIPVCVTVVVLIIAGLSFGPGGSANAASKQRITPTPDRGGGELRAARKLARAIVTNRRWIRGASFSAIPPFGNPAAVSTRRLTHFPRHGRSFAILSTGDATVADDRNLDGATGHQDGGPSIRGSRDVTIFRITLQVPRRARCLSVRFRFLSEEFPEFIGNLYNDAFIAELDVSDWNTVNTDSPRIDAPHNFAADANGKPVSVNATGDASVGAFFRGQGTTYDGATRILRASSPVSPGRHILYMSIFDQGDRDYDSAVFIDRLTLDRRSPCRSGAVKD
jgi:hypothetical protein